MIRCTLYIIIALLFSSCGRSYHVFKATHALTNSRQAYHIAQIREIDAIDKEEPNKVCHQSYSQGFGGFVSSC